MDLGQSSHNGNDSVSFQGEVTALRMSTDTNNEPPSQLTCVSELPGNLVNWVMFDDGTPDIRHPSGCPRTTRCPAGFKGDDCRIKIGTKLFR